MKSTINPAVFKPAVTRIVEPEVNIPRTITIELTEFEAGVLASIIGKVVPHTVQAPSTSLFDTLQHFIGKNVYQEVYRDMWKGKMEFTGPQSIVDRGILHGKL